MSTNKIIFLITFHPIYSLINKTVISSSRFTSSKKYEDDCLVCFKLSGDRRTGQICNACVLIVKRWRKLQPEELRDWSYIVDARALPGVRTLKSRRKKHQEKNKDPLKYKHRYKKKKIQSSNMDPVIGEPKTEGDFPTFLDESYWKRKVTCCGIIFIGELGEVAIEAKSYKKRERREPKETVDIATAIDIDIIAEQELQSITSKIISKQEERKRFQFADRRVEVSKPATSAVKDDFTTNYQHLKYHLEYSNTITVK